jgi:catechol 2,3-dioxygenase-like lactoylglutathione lyase family enzyme
MNLPDALIAHQGFFATHFFTVSDQDKSKDFYVRILGGKRIKPDNPCYIKLANSYPHTVHNGNTWMDPRPN